MFNVPRFKVKDPMHLWSVQAVPTVQVVQGVRRTEKMRDEH
jgi:hypothetical protein